MNELLQQLKGLATSAGAMMALKALIVAVIGLFLAGQLSRRLPVGRLQPQHEFVTRRLVRYTIAGVAIAWALQILGVSLGVLLGAAGLLTVALGFAAQTSASNLISGLFLMAEQPFRVGDIITLGDVTGEVVTIDLLSVRLRTFDNLLVRIPNEAMLRSNVTNLTSFPIRRLDMKFTIGYEQDLARVEATLLEVADAEPICLVEPKPLLIHLGFGPSGVDVQFSVWAARENILDLRNQMYPAIKIAFDQAAITFPAPRRDVTFSKGRDELIQM